MTPQGRKTYEQVFVIGRKTERPTFEFAISSTNFPEFFLVVFVLRFFGRLGLSAIFVIFSSHSCKFERREIEFKLYFLLQVFFLFLLSPFFLQCSFSFFFPVFAFVSFFFSSSFFFRSRIYRDRGGEQGQGEGWQFWKHPRTYRSVNSWVHTLAASVKRVETNLWVSRQWQGYKSPDCLAEYSWLFWWISAFRAKCTSRKISVLFRHFYSDLYLEWNLQMR